MKAKTLKFLYYGNLVCAGIDTFLFLTFDSWDWAALALLSLFSVRCAAWSIQRLEADVKKAKVEELHP